MKHLFFFTTIICTMAIMSCKKNKPGNASFTSQFDFTTTIPAQPNQPSTDTTIMVTSDISIDDDRLDNCDRASLKSFYIEIKEPSNQTFDFCKEVHLLLSAPAIPEVDVVSAVNINPSSRRIDFAVNSIDLVQFLHQKSMTAKVRIVLTKGFSQPIKLYGNMVFNVQGQLK
jgi:hypothetical protein